MGPPRDWLSAAIPRYFSTWLLWSYRRPLGFVLALGLVPLLIILAVTYQLNVTLWRQQTLHNLGVTARLAAEIVEETLQETIRFESLLASQPAFVEAVEQRDRPELAKRLADSLLLIPRVDLGMVLSPEGDVVASAPASDLVGRNVSREDPFLGARQAGGHPYVSAVYLREGPAIEKVVGVVHPIHRGNTLVGLLQVQHRVEQVKSWLQKIRVQPSGFLFVVDHHDQLVVYPFQVIPGRPKVVSDWPPVAHPLPPDGATLTFRDARSRQPWLAAVFPVATVGWRVIAVQPEREALQTLHHVFGLLAGLIVVLLGVIALIGLRWAQLHTFSLRLIRQNAKLLKQLQQRRLFGQGKDPDRPAGDIAP